MPCRFLPLLVLTTALLACAQAQARSTPLVVANLELPASVWPAQQDAVMAILSQAAPDVVVVQGVDTHGNTPPSACALAQLLHMHCDFVTADPPSMPHRRGTALLSAHPVLEDGASLLHGQDGSAPVAAGYLRLLLHGKTIALYSASLQGGIARRQTRLRQAADLRRWMASHPQSTATVVVARFGSGHEELVQLMPDFRTARRNPGSGSAHGLDVLYRSRQAQLQATTTLELQLPGDQADAGSPLASAPVLLGIVVELELPALQEHEA